MGFRTWAAAAALSVCAWAGSAGAAVITVAASHVTINPDWSVTPVAAFDPVELRVGDTLIVTFDITNTAAKYANVFYEFPHNQPPFVVVGTWINRLGLAQIGENRFQATFYIYQTLSGIPDPGPFSVGEIYLRANAAPEPSTWAMMLIGFAGLTALRIRRQRRASEHVDVVAASAVGH